MSDALQVANTRLNDYKMAISKKENEIVELKEMVEDLENFIEFGQALVGKGEEKPRDEKVRQVVVSRPSPQQEAAKDKNDQDDDWTAQEDDAKKGIAQVLSKRTG